jgi:hypothetical protein
MAIDMEAMHTIHAVTLDAFRLPGGDDELKKDVSSPNVIKVITGVFWVHSWANWYPYNFYNRAMDILLVFGPVLGNKLEDTFVSIVRLPVLFLVCRPVQGRVRLPVLFLVAISGSQRPPGSNAPPESSDPSQ